MKKIQKILTSSALTLALMLPIVTMAANPFDNTPGSAGGQLNTIRGTALGTTGPATPLPTIIGNIINVALGFLGILLLGYMLYAGFLWMTSGGSDEKAEQATTMIKNSVIGLLIIVAAFSISSFVLSKLVFVTTGTEPTL